MSASSVMTLGAAGWLRFAVTGNSIEVFGGNTDKINPSPKNKKEAIRMGLIFFMCKMVYLSQRYLFLLLNNKN
jgi:hypothetical protein